MNPRHWPNRLGDAVRKKRLSTLAAEAMPPDINALIPPAHATPGEEELQPQNTAIAPACQHAWTTQEYVGTWIYGAVKKTCHRCARIWIETY